MKVQIEYPNGRKAVYPMRGWVAFVTGRALAVDGRASVRIIGKNVQLWFNPDGSGDYQTRLNDLTWSDNRPFGPNTTVAL